MESTTTPYFDLYDNVFNGTNSFDYETVSDVINNDALNGCRIAIIVLALLLNLVVIVLVICGWVKQTVPQQARPTLLVIAVCSVLLLADTAGLHTISATMYLSKGSLQDFSCRAKMAIELGHATLSAVVRLLVAAVALVAAVRVQGLKSVSPALQLALAALLVLMSVIYGLVVVVPVFFFQTLEDHAQPCYPGSEFLSVTEFGFEVATIPEFAVPQCFILVACVLLLLAYITRSRFSSNPDTYVHYNAVPGQKSSSAEVAQQPGDDPSLRMVTSGQAPPPNTCRFPWHILLAGVVSFLCGILYFVYIRVSWSYESRRRMWAASVVLGQMTGVLLPICWLLDSDVKAFCCGSGRASRPPQAPRE